MRNCFKKYRKIGWKEIELYLEEEAMVKVVLVEGGVLNV